jgi:hypothetical protein
VLGGVGSQFAQYFGVPGGGGVGSHLGRPEVVGSHLVHIIGLVHIWGNPGLLVHTWLALFGAARGGWFTFGVARGGSHFVHTFGGAPRSWVTFGVTGVVGSHLVHILLGCPGRLVSFGGGVVWRCWHCGAVFTRSCKLKQHKDDMHRRIRVRCEHCGKDVMPCKIDWHGRTCVRVHKEVLELKKCASENV